jgi:hypothetical protein
MTMTPRLILAACGAAAALTINPTAWAIPIEYSVEALTGPGNYFRYEYTVTNDGTLPGGAAIGLFDIDFDTARYNKDSLQIVSGASISAEWDQMILQPAPGQVAALYDALSVASGIGVGEIVSGFAVEFQWLGVDPLPSAQSFTIYDPTTFAILATGQTTLRQEPPASVPEPGALALAAATGLALVTARLARRRTAAPTSTA